jgi:hypothetical protein
VASSTASRPRPISAPSMGSTAGPSSTASSSAPSRNTPVSSSAPSSTVAVSRDRRTSSAPSAASRHSGAPASTASSPSSTPSRAASSYSTASRATRNSSAGRTGSTAPAGGAWSVAAPRVTGPATPRPTSVLSWSEGANAAPSRRSDGHTWAGTAPRLPASRGSVDADFSAVTCHRRPAAVESFSRTDSTGEADEEETVDRRRRYRTSSKSSWPRTSTPSPVMVAR